MERLNLAEAYFFIGQRHAALGEGDEALKWYERVLQTRAVPYREMTFARLELQRAKR
jgi:lipoprotein NlpI